MKTLKELEQLLIKELKLYSKNTAPLINVYYNEFAGDISILLTSILGELLFECNNWKTERWLDDLLLTKIELNKNVFSIWGVVISGKEGTLKQWTDPLYFQIELLDDYRGFTEYTFLFSEKECDNMTYKEFTNNRNFWDVDFYSNQDWNPSERDWNYIIKSPAGASVSRTSQSI